jgi:hypothetical protein
LVVDLGQARLAKQRAHDVLDAAALAAAWSLEPGASNCLALATTAAQDVTTANNDSHATKVQGLSVEQSADGKTVTVGGEITINFGFARVLGSEFKSGKVTESSRAVLENIPEFTYTFVPLAVTDWQVQDVQPERQEVLRTPYWVRGGTEPGFAGQPNLYPITFGDSEYDPEVYESLLLGDSPAFPLATGSRAGSIRNDIVQATFDALTARVQGDSRGWIWWKGASNVDKATSKRIIIMPVVSYLDRNAIVGFAGFFVEDIRIDVDNTNPQIPQYKTDVYGRFVPGIVGRKSIRWMMQFWPDYDQTNLMYRVRLIK